MDGVLVIDKPMGVTSHDVVARVKKILGAKKVGHLGTLDPLATGALPLVVNGATKFAETLQKGGKEYEATVKLGEETDTYDSEGKVTASFDSSGVTVEAVKEALKSFYGNIMQLPPMHSAIKRNGVPLYKLARKGVTVEREPKPVEITKIEATSVELPYVTFTVSCSRGTYVRSIAYDLGRILGCGAHLTALRRIRSGMFSLDKSVVMDASVLEMEKAVMPLDGLINGLSEKCGRDKAAV